MINRFETLCQLKKNLYKSGSPIIVSAGLLLKDTQTESIITQFKFQSVSLNKINALIISLEAFDISGKPVKGIDNYQYLDLNIKNGEYFGDNKAIIMPDKFTRSIKIKSIKIILENNIFEISGTDLYPIMDSQKINDSNLLEQFQIDAATPGNFIPREFEDLWICACGKPNSTNVCTECGTTKERVFSSYDPLVLEEHIQQRIKAEEDEKARQLELKKALSERKRKLINKILLLDIKKVISWITRNSDETQMNISEHKKPIKEFSIIICCILLIFITVIISIGSILENN